jgi:predicted permease
MSALMADIRLALRTLRKNPGFAAVALLTLALGLGANTAIFSLWKSVARAPLPAVEDPDGLVMLTNPDASGSWNGTWRTASDGPRSWATWEEFEQLRDEATTFSSLMAVQASLDAWLVRVGQGEDEEIRGRLVSGGFFETLGARPAAGRLFTRSEDGDEPTSAVISHALWQRRFRGRPDAIGTPLRIGAVTVTIVGVAPRGFIGETNGQVPDMWLPLRLQPQVIPGSNWLRDQPPDKRMWLHVFGRLRSGATAAQAEAQANALLHAGLASFYGNVAGDRRRELLDQHFRVSSAARGASHTVGRFSASVAALFGAVGILLLIACANLANLLLARAAGRRTEITLRVSFGASRARLVQQLVTESLVLAAVAGLVAIPVASVLHAVLVRMLQAADPWFVVTFAVDLPVLAFTAAATLLTSLLVGVVPALQATRSEAARCLRTHSRGAIGSRVELRSGRVLVGVQLALALPLLVCAGLLVKTLENLQQPELGFRPERLLLARISVGEAVEDVGRRDRILRGIHTRLQATPGVEAVTFSQLGLFSGGVSTTGVEVEGSPGETPREVALDRVGPGYFAALDIPLRDGRDISPADHAESPKVAIINEEFRRRFFAGRNPIGLRITTGEGQSRTAYQVIGVADNARTQSLRGVVEPRFFVPAEQRRSAAASRVFLIRTRDSVASVNAALRKAASAVDPALAVTEVTPLADRLAELTAEDRAVARLAAAFGAIALVLAAAGLYGVLSYAVTRRTSEIAVRIAVGAQAQTVVGMILRESLSVVLAGMAAGAALAYLAAGVIESRLYEVTAQDPGTIAAVIAVLGLVALVACLIPAARAARIDPMAALRAE